jgi:glycosyltransferase involved in cell wall biosynthesis
LVKKRNITNEKATGDIIVYMDDDDYYPPERVSHAVERLRDSKALCAGSSAMFIFFKHIDKMYQFGPYGPNHATAATFAFKRELLSKTKFNETSSVAEEKAFLKDYTIPFVQLDSKKTILVVSHNHNSFDKKELLQYMPNPNVHDTPIRPNDLIKEQDILKFFMEDVDPLLENYEPGRPENKPDVKKQLVELKEKRENMAKEHFKKQAEQQETLNKISMLFNPQAFQQTQQQIQHYEEQLNQQSAIINQLMNENNNLKSQVNYLTNKIREVILTNIEIKKDMKEEVKEEVKEE